MRVTVADNNSGQSMQRLLAPNPPQIGDPLSDEAHELTPNDDAGFAGLLRLARDGLRWREDGQ